MPRPRPKTNEIRGWRNPPRTITRTGPKVTESRYSQEDQERLLAERFLSETITEGSPKVAVSPEDLQFTDDEEAGSVSAIRESKLVGWALRLIRGLTRRTAR